MEADAVVDNWSDFESDDSRYESSEESCESSEGCESAGSSEDEACGPVTQQDSWEVVVGL